VTKSAAVPTICPECKTKKWDASPVETAKKIDQEGVKLAQQHDEEWIDIGEIWDEMTGEMIQAQRHVRRGTIRKRPDIA
jgi:hypothetical protein